jgi:hypothetical protein
MHTHPPRYLNAAIPILYTTEISSGSEPLLEEPPTINGMHKINYIITKTL